MSNGTITIYRNVPTRWTASFFEDLSQDVIVSEIRVAPNPTAQLLGTWEVSFLTDGTDGELVLELPALNPGEVNFGYMDVKRLQGGSELSPLYYPETGPVLVEFRWPVTA